MGCNPWLNIIEFSEFSVSGVYPEFIPESCSPDSQQGNVSSLDFEFTLGVCLLAFLPGVGGGVKIGKISTFFQPKALIPKSKNQIFQ